MKIGEKMLTKMWECGSMFMGSLYVSSFGVSLIVSLNRSFQRGREVIRIGCCRMCFPIPVYICYYLIHLIINLAERVLLGQSKALSVYVGLLRGARSRSEKPPKNKKGRHC